MDKKLIINSLYLSNDDSGYIYYNGKLFTGIEEWYNKDGVLGSRTEYIDGLQDGTMVGYYENGTVRSESQYKKGCVHGKCIEYYPNGIKKIEEDIYNGKAINTKEWDEQGNLITDK